MRKLVSIEKRYFSDEDHCKFDCDILQHNSPHTLRSDLRQGNQEIMSLNHIALICLI